MSGKSFVNQILVLMGELNHDLKGKFNWCVLCEFITYDFPY